ncbi:thiamine pyrophosphate-binding protein [Nonomuraea endophytica]|uniref:Tartronate-semialdehyde synthase n=1 Tax=Nonomuraea endophytica TaxID=714136 RepID=A0A7W8EI10_9ACTN|nr:thiamine pyrophosphate-binding protein [Nonomuraea endophytica]MBB5080154.1 tartronate-semialdehyde synthase [Nonomuraea endophytica]
MTRVACAEAVVAVLESEGVDTVFGTGDAVPPLDAALRDSSIRHVTVRHEAGGAHAADGWARTTGNVGVCVGASGTNMITGLHAALADSVPLLCVTGREPFQSAGIVEIARPVTKWAVQLRESAQAPWVFREAFRVARSGRPGPVLVDLPADVQRGTCLYDRALDAPLPVAVPRPLPHVVRAALDLVCTARRPLILAGGGVVTAGAGDELLQLAEHLQIPVQVTLMGKGAFPEDHPLFAGLAGTEAHSRWGNAAFLRSDLVLAVGARFADRHTGDLDVYRKGRRFIHVDIEPTQLGRVFEPDLGVFGHAQPVLAEMVAEARSRTAALQPGKWVRRVGELRRTMARRDDFDDVPIKPPRVFREINGFYPRDTTFVTGTGLHQIWSGQFQTTYLPRRYLACGQAGPPGWEVPAAMGAKCARPERQVVAVAGFPFLTEEVAVAARHRIPLVIVMINNAGLGRAELPYDMNDAMDLHDGEGGVDHVRAMESLGCPARRVDRPGDIRDALAWASAEAARTRVPVLVEVMVEREAKAATGPALDAIKEFEPLPELVTVDWSD